MALFAVYVSDHPCALMASPVTQQVMESWTRVFNGVATAPQMMSTFKQLQTQYAHVRVFKGNRTIGRIWLEG